MSIELANKKSATADEKLLNILRNELLIAKEMLKGISNAFNALGKGEYEAVRWLFEEVRKSKENAVLLQRSFLDYFSAVAPSLYSKEEWLGVSSKMLGVLDKLGGVTYRVEYLVSRSWSVPMDIQTVLVDMVVMLISMMDEYMAMINALTRGKATEIRGRISVIEASIDSKYREATFKILEANISASLMILLLSIAEMLEDVSDLVDSAADDIYLLAVV
ncbi:MAG: hypothetical protein QXY49_05660 [Thermofilaceae archaeon]